ncbi:aminopeptidase [Olsenella urininfantis]|uniref:aminopeptidase n=1 Tax=Olsenella urininfantis TaxID=1871033 RepID=UPI0009843367|nr:aminopeptidase [Olsenella urininfantis]
MGSVTTAAEWQRAIEGLSSQIDGYAELLVRKGAVIEKGQELVVQSPVECADFARRVVREAYACGAGHVTVIWADDAMTRMEYENVGLEYFKHTPSWKVEQLNSLAEKGASFLFLEGRDPSALDGIDPAKPAAASRARNVECGSFRNGMDFGRNVWCIAGVPVRAWAGKVFPDSSADEAVYRLWELILQVARASGEDPQAAWETHNATFEKNKRQLNEDAFDSLRYRSSNGTNLLVGLNKGHIWEGGAARTVSGTAFFPNIPTEEVFTTPDCRRATGIVHSAMPLVHAGQIVDDFWLRFEEGRVVEYDAAVGKDVLTHILETDENARRLGECALISKNTPIRQSGVLFFDTLYDENASCHLALGMGFPECLEGGLDMDKDALFAHGVNQSATHVDFMIGADDLSIMGLSADGKETPVFENGQWAWELR